MFIHDLAQSAGTSATLVVKLHHPSAQRREGGRGGGGDGSGGGEGQRGEGKEAVTTDAALFLDSELPPANMTPLDGLEQATATTTPNPFMDAADHGL